MEPLTADEEQRCTAALAAFEIDSPRHEALRSDRHLAIYLSGITFHPGIGGDRNVSHEDYKDYRRLLSRAGAEKLKGMVPRRSESGLFARPSFGSAPTNPLPSFSPPGAPQLTTGTIEPLSEEEEARLPRLLVLFHLDSPAHQALRSDRHLALHLAGITFHGFKEAGSAQTFEEFKTMRQLLSRAGADKLRQVLGAPPLAPIARPPQAPPPPTASRTEVPKLATVPAPLPSSSRTDVPKLSAPPAPSRTDVPKLPPAPGIGSPSKTEVPKLSPGSSSAENPKPASGSMTNIDLETLSDVKEWGGAGPLGSGGQGNTLVADLVHNRRFAEAFKVCHDHLVSLPELNGELLVTCAAVIEAASRYNRKGNVAPANMVKECVALAKFAEKKLPDLTRASDDAASSMTNLTNLARAVYKGWGRNCRAVFEYKYKTGEGKWLQRSWIDPGEFSVLMDVLGAAVRAKLPLNLLMEVYQELYLTIQIGHHVITNALKAWKFEGDVLRIVASPTKDVVPDLCLHIFRKIIKAYMAEGDSASSYTFVNQALLLRKGDRELEELKVEIERMRHATDPKQAAQAAQHKKPTDSFRGRL